MVSLLCPFRGAALFLCSSFRPNIHISSFPIFLLFYHFFLFFQFFPDELFSLRCLILGLVSFFSNSFPWSIVLSLFLLPDPGGPLGYMYFPSKLVLLHGPSFNRASRYASSIHRLVLKGNLETKLWLSICHQFSPLPTQPHFAPLSKTNKVHRVSLSYVCPQSHVCHSVYFVSLYFFPVIIFHLSLSQNQTFPGAYTDASIPHAAILRTPGKCMVFDTIKGQLFSIVVI